MVFVKLACLALIASLCGMSRGQCMPRARPCAPPPRAVPLAPLAPPASCRPNPNAAYIYERNLEGIISKLINALIYITLQNNSGGGAGAGSGNSGASSGNSGASSGSSWTASSASSGGGGKGAGGLDNLLDSLLHLDVGLGGTDLLNVGLLGGGGSSSGNSGSGTSSSSGSGAGSSGLLNDLADLNLSLNDQKILSLILLGGNRGAGGSSMGSPDLLNVDAKLLGKNLANVGVL